jgi:hypothetical protein
MTLIHRLNTTPADVIANLSSQRFANLTAEWGGFSNTTNTSPNWGRVMWEVVSVYPDAVGPIAWFVLFLIPFIMMWITHADLLPAALVGIFFGLYVFVYIGDQYYWLGLLMIGVAIAAVLLSVYQKRA